MIDCRFVKAGDGSKGSRNQVKLVLNNEIGGREWPFKPSTLARFTRAIETVFVGSISEAEECPCLPQPRKPRKLIHRGDEKTRQAAINGFVYGDNREVIRSLEGAIARSTNDSKIFGVVERGKQQE
jgi:hypothetical protein